MDYETLLEFWFGKEPTTAQSLQARSKIWFSKNPDFDSEVRTRFEQPLLSFETFLWKTWPKTPRGVLASIILLDQVPRNIYRNDPRSFQWDPIALELSKNGIEQKADLDLELIERVFFYLPLEHSEVLADQEKSVVQFQNLLRDTPRELDSQFSENLDYAVKHWEIIQQFGRFPHRNKILGRQSTPEEEVFLRKPGSSF